MEIAPSTTIDRYRVEGMVGQGGMAQVYRVQHLQLGSTHALKVLTAPSQAVRERLLQEGRAQAQLRHNNIVAVTDVVDVQGSPGLVMEYISGPNLGDLLRAYREGVDGQSQLALPQVDQLARGILSGVMAAHEFGLVHRDLKPANILLELREGEVIPKVADFGLVKVIEGEGLSDANMTRSGMALGTPSYMAPEQVRDTKTMDQRGDLFALGAILYELATGTRAFDGEDMMEIFQAVVQGETRPLLSLRKDLPERMHTAITAALVVDRDERVQTCRELLTLWCAGEPQSLPWEIDVLRWPQDQLNSLKALGSGPHSAPGVLSEPTPRDTQSWESAVPMAGSAPATIARPSPADGTLSREMQAPPEHVLTPKKSRTKAPWIALMAGIAVLGLLGLWRAQQDSEPANSRGKRTQQRPPAQPAVTPLETADAPPAATVEPKEEDTPEAVEEAAEEPEQVPTLVVPEIATPGVSPSAAAASTASFSFTGEVDGVRLRGNNKYYGPGELPPGTYQVYLRMDGDTKRVLTVTLSAGEHISFKCNRLGCK